MSSVPLGVHVRPARYDRRLPGSVGLNHDSSQAGLAAVDDN